jgi:two-component system sensor histidine kinase KdpD
LNGNPVTHPINTDQKAYAVPALTSSRPSNWLAYGRSMLLVIVFTFISRLMSPYFEPANLIMIYIVGVVLAAMWFGRGPAILASLLSVAAFDFFFVPPFLTFAVADTQYVLTFAVMLLVAIIISDLTGRTTAQAEIAQERERRTANLYAMSRGFASSSDTPSVIQIAAQHIGDLFRSRVMVLLPDKSGQLSVCEDMLDQHEQGVAQWVYDCGQMAGSGTERLPASEGLYVPLTTSRGTAGVLAIYPNQVHQTFSPDQLRLLETFASQTALAVERTLLAEETRQASVQIATERLRNALLSSVSHDLRTPLAAITGAVSGLLANDYTLSSTDRRELAQVAFEESERLNRLVGNLLQMTRLESGGVQVEKDWQVFEEVVGSALNRLSRQVSKHHLTVTLPADLPLVAMDSILIEQVLVNLIENAVKYTPVGTTIELSAQARSDEVVVQLADRGPGLLPGTESRIFDKFYRSQPGSAGGVGLGLTICRGIVEAHGGEITARNRSGGGAVFMFTLPLTETPPEMSAENADA